MIIHDADNSDWPAGRYRLTAVCAGFGSIVANFGIGAYGEVKELAPCTNAGSVDYVEIELPTTATGLTVVLVPAGDSRAAVGYTIQKI
ncbi:MAG TPA: hypothetical protein VFU07_03735 [Candidatus Lumbricidophila sp.]|nr:hypothetical protein [Candidatus Lumbricidophila sp.]